MKEGLGTTNQVRIIPPEAQSFSKHLKGAKPIIACIGSLDNFQKSERSRKYRSTNFGNLRKINWESGTYESKNGYITGGERTYVISGIDSSNKFSQGLMACTGLIVAGVDKETGRNVSFATHQFPPYSFGNEFAAHLEERLQEMRKRCKLGTVDAVVVGGIYPNDVFNSPREDYLKTIKLLSDKMLKIFKFEPIVINGPKQGPPKDRQDDFYYDNRNRRLLFVRPEDMNSNTGNFIPSNVGREKGKWKEDKKA